MELKKIDLTVEENEIEGLKRGIELLKTLKEPTMLLVNEEAIAIVLPKERKVISEISNRFSDDWYIESIEDQIKEWEENIKEEEGIGE